MFVDDFPVSRQPFDELGAHDSRSPSRVDLGVELDAEDWQGSMLEGLDRVAARGGGQHEIGWQVVDVVVVMLEGVERPWQVVEQATGYPGQPMNPYPAGGRAAIDADEARFAESRGDGLVTEADAEQRDLLTDSFEDEVTQVSEGFVAGVESPDAAGQHDVRVVVELARQVVTRADQDAVIGLDMLAEGIAGMAVITCIIVDDED